jgi:hypothetical protein
MAIHKAIDSDVDRITQFALRGVNAFIAMYQDDEPGIAAGPAPRAKTIQKPAPKKQARRTRR